MNGDALAEKVDQHDKVLFGRDGEPGIAHQVKFMWRLHVWILCSLSGVAGYGFHWLLQTFGKS